MAGGVSGLQRIGPIPLGPFTVAEWTPTVLLVPLALLETMGGRADQVLGPPAGVAACLVVAGVSLLWRQRQPLPVLATVCTALLSASLAWGSSQVAAGVLCMVVAIFACGAHARRPWSLLGLPIGVGTTLVFIARDPIDTVANSWMWALNLLWIYGLGAWVHQNAQLVAQAGAESAALAAAAAAEDRVRIARELHDVLGHNLAVMIVQAEAADELLESDPDRAHQALSNVARTGRSALDDIRSLVGALRLHQPQARTDGAGVPGAEAVWDLIDAVRASGLPVDLQVTGSLGDVPEPAGQAAYRVIQESLTNTLRHVGPVPTQVSVVVGGGRLEVQVHDEGAGGVVTHASTGRPGGHGLSGMRERVEEIGGRFDAGPDPTGGFTVTAELPVAAVPP